MVFVRKNIYHSMTKKWKHKIKQPEKNTNKEFNRTHITLSDMAYLCRECHPII